MFELEVKNTEDDKNFASGRLNTLKKIIESLADIVGQMEIKANDRGLAIQVMDSMHAALADIFLSKEMFTSFRCDRNIHLGIPIKHFVTILRGICLEETSLVKFSCEDTPQVLRIEHTMADSKYEFDITLYQIGSENYTVPKMDYCCSVQLPSEQFRSISRIIGSFGEYISFKCEKESFFFKQTGDLTKNTMNLKPNGTSITVDCSEPVEVEIAMKYVNLINKVSSLSSKISVSLGVSSPVYFDIELYDLLGHVRLYVAPKVNG